DLQDEIAGQVAGALHAAEDHQLAHVGNEHRVDAERGGVAHILDAVSELIDTAQRRAEYSPRRARRLDADVPVGAWTDEQTDFDPVFAPEREHPADLLVGLQHDAAALADSMNRHRVLARGG